MPTSSTAPGNLRELVARSETEGYDLVSLMVRLQLPQPLGKAADPGLCVLLLQALSAALGGRSGAPNQRRGGRVHADPGRDPRPYRRDRQHPARDHRRLRARPPGQIGRQGVARPLGRRRGASANTDPGAPIWDMVVRSAFAQLGYSAAMLGLTVLEAGADLSGAAAAAAFGAARRGAVRRRSPGSP